MARRRKIVTTKFRPTAGYLFVDPLEPEEKTASGIYLPETSKDKPQAGRVVAVGPEVVTDSGVKKKSPAKVEDNIIFTKWGGNEITMGADEYLFVKFEDVLAVEEPEAKKKTKKKGRKKK